MPHTRIVDHCLAGDRHNVVRLGKLYRSAPAAEYGSHEARQRRRGDHHQDVLEHAEEVVFAKLAGHRHQVAFVQVVADLQPVGEDGNRW